MVVRSLPFKYYIHDSIDACRLQLIGVFTAQNVKDLEGCWTTARTTLSQRKLVVDTVGLESVDEAGRMWLAVMVAEGANLLEGPASRAKSASKSGLLRRLFCALPRAAEQSPTQAQ
jgi:hypothetical protein